MNYRQDYCWQYFFRSQFINDSLPLTKFFYFIADHSVDFKSLWGVTDANAIVFFKDSLHVVGGRRSGHMTSRGFANRHKRHTIASKSKRYEGTIVIDSPEMLRALDSHTFADFKAALLRCARFPLFVPFNIPRHFHFGMPALNFSHRSSARGVSLLQVSSASSGSRTFSCYPSSLARSSRRGAALLQMKNFAVSVMVDAPKRPGQMAGGFAPISALPPSHLVHLYPRSRRPGP